MAKINGIGFSDTTLQKQIDFISIMKMLCHIWKGTIKQYRANKNVFYYDLNGGQGYSLDIPIIGSPLIAAIALKDSELLHNGFICERSPENILRLEAALMAYNSFEIIKGDNRSALEGFLPKTGDNYGLIYADPTGYPVNEFNFLRAFDSRPGCSKLDVLLSLSAHTARRVGRAYPDLHNFEIHRKSIGKGIWFIREMEGKHKWTFLLGTNWGEFPAPRFNFHRLDSNKGQEIYNYIVEPKKKVAHTGNEGMQLTLPIESI